MRFLFCFYILLMVYNNDLYSQSRSSGILAGHVIDSVSKEPMEFVNITLIQNDKVMAVTLTDQQGYYAFRSLPEGTYDIKYTYLGYRNQVVTAKKIHKKETLQDMMMVAMPSQVDEVIKQTPYPPGKP